VKRRLKFSDSLVEVAGVHNSPVKPGFSPPINLHIVSNVQNSVIKANI
jgi:hypothetical protein